MFATVMAEVSTICDCSNCLVGNPWVGKAKGVNPYRIITHCLVDKPLGEGKAKGVNSYRKSGNRGFLKAVSCSMQHLSDNSCATLVPQTAVTFVTPLDRSGWKSGGIC